MTNRGFRRKGALQMTSSILLMSAVFALPFCIDATQPEIDWLLVLTGAYAYAAGLVVLFLLALYGIGFLRYCCDKGYSNLVGLVLLLAAPLGLLALLLLPDIKHPEIDIIFDKNLRHAH